MNELQLPNYLFNYYYIIDPISKKIDSLLILCRNIISNRYIWEMVDINTPLFELDKILKNNFNIESQEIRNKIINDYKDERINSGGFPILEVKRSFRHKQRRYMNIKIKDNLNLALAKHIDPNYPRNYWSVFPDTISGAKDKIGLKNLGFTGKRCRIEMEKFMKYWKVGKFSPKLK